MNHHLSCVTQGVAHLLVQQGQGSLKLGPTTTPHVEDVISRTQLLFNNFRKRQETVVTLFANWTGMAPITLDAQPKRQARPTTVRDR